MRNWEVFILVNEKFFDRPNKRNQNHIGRKTFAITTLCMGSILCLGMHTHDAEAAEMPNAPVEHETQIESTGDQTKENRDSIPENQRQKLPNTQTRAPEATSLKQGDVSSEQVSNHQMAQTSQPQTQASQAPIPAPKMLSETNNRPTETPQADSTVTQVQPQGVELKHTNQIPSGRTAPQKSKNDVNEIGQGAKSAVNKSGSRDDAVQGQPYRIGNQVWEDLNRNGKQDADEPGVRNVNVRLTDNRYKLLKETQTDANGRYLFTDLINGRYYIFFETPTGYTPTRAFANGTTTDNDSNTRIDLVDINNKDDLSVDFGIYKDSTLSESNTDTETETPNQQVPPVLNPQIPESPTPQSENPTTQEPEAPKQPESPSPEEPEVPKQSENPTSQEPEVSQQSEDSTQQQPEMPQQSESSKTKNPESHKGVTPEEIDTARVSSRLMNMSAQEPSSENSYVIPSEKDARTFVKELESTSEKPKNKPQKDSHQTKGSHQHKDNHKHPHKRALPETGMKRTPKSFWGLLLLAIGILFTIGQRAGRK